MNKISFLYGTALLALLCGVTQVDSVQAQRRSPRASVSACSIFQGGGYVSRIINGRVCKNNYSGIVKLSLTDSRGDGFQCTGTAIDPYTVVFAAHCVEDITSITVETYDGNYEAVSFAGHPDWNGNASHSETNDVAVLTVAQPMPIATFPLLATNDLVKGEKMAIAGFGQTESGRVSSKLRAGFMKLAKATSDSILAKFTGSGSNTCSGDSGGPLVVNRNGVWYLAGATSNGLNENCGPGDRSYFVNLTAPSNRAFIAQFAPSLFQ